MLPNKMEFPCQTIDMSPGGVKVAAPSVGAVGQKVVFYFETLGRLEGEIARLTRGGFAVALSGTSAKRERLADLLTWLVNHDNVGLPEDRRHRRIAPRNCSATLVLSSGRQVECEIIDVSISGVGVKCDVAVEMGARVEIGKRVGKVVRVFDGGVALEFTRLVPIEEFDEDIIL